MTLSVLSLCVYNAMLHYVCDSSLIIMQCRNHCLLMAHTSLPKRHHVHALLLVWWPAHNVPICAMHPLTLAAYMYTHATSMLGDRRRPMTQPQQTAETAQIPHSERERLSKAGRLLAR